MRYLELLRNKGIVSLVRQLIIKRNNSRTIELEPAICPSEINDLLNKWRSYEKEMAEAREIKEGPLRWLPLTRMNEGRGYTYPLPTEYYLQFLNTKRQSSTLQGGSKGGDTEASRKYQELERKRKEEQERKAAEKALIKEQEKKRKKAEVAMTRKIKKVQDIKLNSTLVEMAKRHDDNKTKMVKEQEADPSEDPRGQYNPKRKWSPPMFSEDKEKKNKCHATLIPKEGPVAAPSVEDDDDCDEPADLPKKNVAVNSILEIMEKRREGMESVMEPEKIKLISSNKEVFDATKF